MARIISIVTDTIQGININTVKTDGSVDTKTFFENDTIENLRYNKDGVIKTITGRLAKIHYKYEKVNYSKFSASTLKNMVGTEIKIFGITVDASEVYNAATEYVDVREIVEFEDGDNVKRCYVSPVITTKMTLNKSTESATEVELVTDTDITGLGFIQNRKLVRLDGKLKAVKYVDKKDLVASGIVVSANNKTYEIGIDNIVEFGEVSTLLPADTTISDALTNSTEEVAFISVPSGEFADPITVNKDTVIKGANAGVSASTGARASRVIGSNETVISGKINAEAGTSLVLDGVTLTGDAMAAIGTTATNVELKNCKFVDVKPYQAKSYLVDGKKGENCALVIENCYFGPNPADAETGYKYYNLFELNTVLKDGSRICNNYFAKEACNHNAINIYDVEEGATVTIAGNHFEYSANAIRLGIKGEPKCTIVIEDNRYDETDTTYPEYAGLLLIQSYGSATTSWNNCTVILNDNYHTDNAQLWYSYSGGSDTLINETNTPTVIVDGKVEVAPVEAPATEEPAPEQPTA